MMFTYPPWPQPRPYICTVAANAREWPCIGPVTTVEPAVNGFRATTALARRGGKRRAQAGVEQGIVTKEHNRNLTNGPAMASKPGRCCISLKKNGQARGVITAAWQQTTSKTTHRTHPCCCQLLFRQKLFHPYAVRCRS